jgi:hypothetical protein
MQIDTALPIVRALADGNDPYSGELFCETSPYANPVTMRALFAAIEVMERESARQQRMRRLPPNAGKPWNDREDGELADAFDRGMPIRDMAHRHARTLAAIQSRLEKLGKITPASP